jgi:deazaflavin-dependent oxidoreductase (nitroreductase family)
MTFLHRLRLGFLNVLKNTLNPVTRRLARAPFGPFAVIQHVGRRSGKHYETPIMARVAPDGFVIELTYGYDVDWHRNVLAAGGCTLIWHGQAFAIYKLEKLPSDVGMAAFAAPQQLVLRLLNRTHFELMKTHDHPH